MAGSVHAAKSSARPPVANASTGGTAAPVLSTLEDIASFGLTILAIFDPLIMLVALAALLLVFWRGWRKGPGCHRWRSLRSAWGWRQQS